MDGRIGELVVAGCKNSHAEYLHQQIVGLAPDGVDEMSRDLESGSDRIWYRVRVPDLRALLKKWKSENTASLTFEEWSQTVDNLYHGKSIDERAFAGMLVAAFPKFRRELSLAQLDIWLGQLEGWKEIDNTCQSGFTADDLLADWKTWQRFLRKLSVDKNMNKRRASLVLLVKPLRSEEACFLDLALELVDSLKHEKDKLITKAVSWILRGATIHHHDEIRTYLGAQQSSLPAIAVRETKRKLLTGKK